MNAYVFLPSPKKKMERFKRGLTVLFNDNTYKSFDLDLQHFQWRSTRSLNGPILNLSQKIRDPQRYHRMYSTVLPMVIDLTDLQVLDLDLVCIES